MMFFELLKQYASAKQKMLLAEKEYKELKDKSNLYRTICEDITKVTPSYKQLRKIYHNDCKDAKLRYKQACRKFSETEYNLIICVGILTGKIIESRF